MLLADSRTFLSRSDESPVGQLALYPLGLSADNHAFKSKVELEVEH